MKNYLNFFFDIKIVARPCSAVFAVDTADWPLFHNHGENNTNIAFINRVIKLVIKLYFIFRLITRWSVLNAFYITDPVFCNPSEKISLVIVFCIFRESIKMSLGQVLRSTFQ